MISRYLKTITLVAASVSALAWTATASAQASRASSSSDKNPESASEGDIIVTGIRASLADAIDRKRNASTTVDSIVAEDVAKFPDKNVGEALSRITGVQLTRDFGEGVQVSIRGVEPDLNRVEVNGATTLGQGSRGNDFRELAAELIKSVDVYKGYSVDLTEGGIGGTVAITTRKPLELKKPLFVVSAAAQTVDTLDGWKPRGTLAAGTKFLDGRVGVLFNATYDRNDTKSDFIRNTEWVRLADLNGDGRRNTTNPNFTSISTLAGCNAVSTTGSTGATRADCQAQFFDFSPRIPRYGIWIRNDKRLSLEGTVQAQLADNLKAYVGLQYNERNNRLIDYNYQMDLTATARITTGSSVTVDPNGNVIGLTTAATAPTTTTGAGSIITSQKRDFAFVQKSTYWTGGFEWDIGNLNVTGFGVTSKSSTIGDTNSIAFSSSPRSVRITLDPVTGVPTFGFPAGYDPTAASAYTFNAAAQATGPALQYRPTESENNEDQFKLDFDLNVDRGFLKSIEWGIQYRKASSLSYAGGGFLGTDGRCVPSANITINPVVNGSAENLTVASPCTGAAPNPAPTLTPIWSPARLATFLAGSTESTPGPFYQEPGFSAAGIPTGWLAPNFNLVPDNYNVTGFNHDCVRVCNGVPQIPSFAIDEKIWAGYFKINIDTRILGMRMFGNLGLRVVNTKDVSLGSNIVRERRPASGPAGFTDVTVGTSALSLKNEYWDWLPAFNAALEVTSNVVVRANWAQVMARPKFTDLAPAANCLFDLTAAGLGDNINDGCTAGNPYLDPYRASEWDVNASWFPNRNTAFTIGYYQKNISSFILSRTLVRNVNYFGDGRLFDVTMPINGRGATQRGIELSAQTSFDFLPAPFNGLGAIANLTYSTSSDVGLINQLTGDTLPFPFLSKYSYNLTGYYEKGGLSIRGAYNWRSRYLISAAERSGNPVFRDASGYLDGRIGYTFKLGPIEKFEIFGEAKNILGTAERSTADDIRLTELAYSGRRFFVGFRAAF